MRRFTVARSLAPTLVGCLAGLVVAPAAADTPKARDLQTSPQVAREILKPVPRVTPQRPPVGANGDGATSWVSPLLLNHPGTISGERYTIGGRAQEFRFGFQVVNGDATRAVRVRIDCYRPDGAHEPRYTSQFLVDPMGAAAWLSTSVAPVVTDDRVTADEDTVWCHISSERPVFAFGQRSRVDGAERTSDAFSLLPAGR